MLKVQDLKVSYGDFVAVPSASLSVPDGQIVSLIGTNGAGKSSFLNAVAGLVQPAAGRVFFDDEEITGKPACEIVQKGLCLVPQGGHCFDRMSVEENLLMGSYPKEARRHRRESLERVYSLFPDLFAKRKEAAGSLSGGQRQMTAIGRALMSGPKCLLFDEISLGLAPVVIGELYSCIRRINQESNTAVVLVEQDTERALRISDVCHIMLKGTIVLSGKSATLSKEEIQKAYFGFQSRPYECKD